MLIEKETAKRRKATGIYTRMVNAGQQLMEVIRNNEGGAFMDLQKFTDQILALCEMWER